ncbi:DUF2182 domain-containing protein [Janthinobacterium sp. 17J80-10]|uniref:DUF2182 domain-containing protein n=1 Tax=Janthinobacterium sp. 17J80-10 TaxID=2497863 RepID=UPI001005812F|nr:DUF2182 domain-containing protein [Janthinobacterium sp. 17J80-10]QAU34901.1 DUF2182 domain-containing protein [Janthinobacterium sp. 17J80-10]
MASTRRFPGRVAELASSLSTGTGPAASIAALSGRDRIVIGLCLVVVVALAWAYLFYLDRMMAPAMAQDAEMAGMAMVRQWSAADFLFTLAMWVVMMIGMMVASATPVLLLFAAAHARRGGGRVPLAVLAFALGYLLAWSGFALCAVLAQWALHQAALLSPQMALSSAQAGGAVLVAAGLYQMTPLKRACLQHCQSPLGFLLSHWREGIGGALQMGMRHGAWCLGCCWALMAVLFVVGVMNLAWVAALAVFILLEKLAPAGVTVSRVAGAAMMVAGMMLLAGQA